MHLAQRANIFVVVSFLLFAGNVNGEGVEGNPVVLEFPFDFDFDNELDFKFEIDQIKLGWSTFLVLQPHPDKEILSQRQSMGGYQYQLSYIDRLWLCMH